MNWKKALAAGTLAVAAVTMVAGCGGNANKQAEQKLPDKIVIGLDDNFPPMASAMTAVSSSASTSTWHRKRPSAWASPSNSSPSTGTARKQPSRANRSTCSGTA